MGRKLNIAFCFLLVIIFISEANSVQQWNVLLGFLLASSFSFVAFLFHRLTLDGMFAAIVIGVFIFGFGGWPAALAVLLFFVSSAAISVDRKSKAGDVTDSVRRNGHQVWANGFWFITTLTISVIFDNSLFIVGALGALATATADTWGTETGMKFSNSCYLITNFQKVPAGTEGGMSVQGTLSALFGSGLIASSGVYFFSMNLDVFICIFVAGFLGSIADSYFGATFQRNNSSVVLPIYRDPVRIDNNIVNGIATGIGALLAIILNLIFI